VKVDSSLTRWRCRSSVPIERGGEGEREERRGGEGREERGERPSSIGQWLVKHGELGELGCSDRSLHLSVGYSSN